jgi:adenylate cyclase
MMNRRLQGWLKRALPYGIGGIILGCFVISPLAEELNLLTYDLVTSSQGKESANSIEQEFQVSVVGIGEEDIARYGWPISDTYLCKAIDRLEKSGAKAIALDLYRNQSVPPHNKCLEERVRTNARLISIRNMMEGIPAIPGTPATQQGFNDLVVDNDRVIRRDLIHVKDQSSDVRSLALRLLEKARGVHNLDTQIESLPDSTWLTRNTGGYFNLPAEGYQTMLPFQHRGAVKTWKLSNILDNNIDEKIFNNSIVLIGSTAASVKDVYEIPHSYYQKSDKYLEIPGVEIHAWRVLSLSNLLRQGEPSIQTIGQYYEILLSLLLFCVGIAIAETPKLIRNSATGIGIAVVTVATGIIFLQLKANYWIGISLPLGALTLSSSSGLLRRGLVSQKHQQDIQRLLGQTSSKVVAEQLWEQKDKLLKDGKFIGREQHVTIIFSDACNFTSVSEQLRPSELMDWLNRGISITVDAVDQHGGMVNKFTGDGILAVFGAPLSNGITNDAQQAIKAAREIQENIGKLNNELLAENLHPMKLRIGIHTGIVLTGSLGNSQRLEYAVIGDTVNCASRLESCEKNRQTNLVRVLVSSETRDQLGDADHEFGWVSWGSLAVKGRKKELFVFELKDRELEAE